MPLSVVNSEPLPPLSVVSSAPLPPVDLRPRNYPGSDPAADDPANQGFWHSMYSQSIEPVVSLVWDSIKRGDLGEQAAKDVLSGFTRELGTFAAHPDIRNLPMIGTGATATADRMAKQFAAGNYKGVIGSAAGFLAPFGAPEAIKATEGIRATVGGAMSDAGTAAAAAAPDLTSAAVNAAKAYAAHGLGFGTLTDLMGLKWAWQAKKALGRAGSTALDAWQDARAARAPAADAAPAAAEAAPAWEPGPTPPARGPYSGPIQQWEPGAPETYGTPRPPAAWDPHVPGEAPPEAPPQWDPHVPAAPAAAATPFDLAPDARASLPPELVAKVDQLRDLSHAAAQPLPETPGLTPEQRLADRIDEHAAFLKMQAQDLEHGARAARADRIAGILIKNDWEPTDAMIAQADKITTNAKTGSRTPAPSDETADMVRDRVEWYQARAAREQTAGPVELEEDARPAEQDDAAEPAAIPGTGSRAADQTGGVQQGGTGERAPLQAADSVSDRGQPAPRSTRRVAQGDGTTVRVAGDPKQYVARYGVKELADIQPSHNGLNFEENPKYEHVNDRQYKDPNNQAKIVNGSVEGPTGFEEREVINTAPNASTGPPVLDSRDNVLGGNGRTNIIQRVFAGNPAGAARYRRLLDDTAHHFGIDPAEYAHMKQPVLVRTLEPAETADAGAAQRAITDFNKIGTAAMTPAERAIADARGISQKTLDDIAQRIEHAGDEGEPGTLAQALEGKGGVQVLQKLIDDGVISPQERADLANESQLTRSGRERISNLMLGRFFTNAKQLDNLPLAMRGKMERIAAPLARVEGNEAYSLSPTFREALDLLDAADAHGAATIGDFVNQRGLYADRQFSPASVALAEQLKTRTPNDLTNAVRQYAARAKYAAEFQGKGMFGDIPEPMTRGEAFDESFGPEALKRERAAKEKAKAEKAAAKATEQ